MKIPTVFRPFHDADEIEGTVSDDARAEHDRRVREARLETARKQPSWAELPQTRLVQRGRFLVDADSDLAYRLRRGHVWDRDSASVGYVTPDTSMTYYVDEHDNVVFLEQALPTTWSEVVARQARRG